MPSLLHQMSDRYPTTGLACCVQIWTYEGSNTLSGYLRRRDCLAGIARDLGCPEQVAVSMVMKQILENLQVGMHLILHNPLGTGT